MSDWSELGRALGADDAEERRRGTARLRDAGEHVPAELLTRALADSDWRVRKEAVLTAIALAPSPQVLEVLIAALGPGDNVGLRNAAVDALSGYGVHAIPPLARALSNLDADGKKLVVDVLSKSARPEGLPLLKGLLRDADVMSMRHALEVRVPLVDHVLVDHVMRLPAHVKLDSKVNKPLLTKAVGDLPEEVLHKPKMGFCLPFGDWLRGPLRPWADEMLLGGPIRRLPFMNAAAAADIWHAFLEGRVAFSRVFCLTALIAYFDTHDLSID